VSGLRKPETSKPAALPKAPAAAKQVPGLPGVVQKPSKASTKSTSGRPTSGKRKTPANDFTPVKQIVPGTLAPGAELDNNSSPEQSAKRSKQNSKPSLPFGRIAAPAAVPVAQPAAAMLPPRQPPRNSTFPMMPPPQSFTFSPLPVTNNLEKMLEESRRNFVELQTLFNELQEENTALKTASIRDQVEELFAQHTERVLEHGEKASDLAAHWREEAEKMATLLAESRVEEVGDQNRTLRAELATARQALLDLEISKAEQEKAIVELQKRNVHLERYARKKPAMANKCVGTDDPVVIMQAHAMCPEGAAGSSLYRGVYAGMQQHENMMMQQQHHGGFGVDAPFSLRNQRTAPYISSSDMNLASNGGAGGPVQQQHVTEESVQANARANIRGRRVSALPVPGPLQARKGQTAADVSRQIQFYSNSLSAVPEEAHAQDAAVQAGPSQQEQQQQQLGSANAPSTGVLLSRGQGLMMAAHMDTKPLKGGKFQFTHHLTGYSFILGNDPDPNDPAMPELDIHYQPLHLGTAEAALRRVCGAQPDLLLEEGWFSEEQAEMFFGFVCQAMGICAMEQK
jgi:hypothetical protein